MSGLKYDQGKPRIELIPPEILFALGELYAVGAKKYTKTLSIEEATKSVLSSLQNVTLLYRITQKECVEVVTKSTYDHVTQNLHKDSVITLTTGLSTIKNEKLQLTNNTESKTNLVLMNTKGTGKALDLASLLKMLNECLKNRNISVQSVKDQVIENDLILITITAQDLPEDFYAETAIRRSDYLMIMQTICSQHSNIFNTFQVTIDETTVELSGDRNWEQGMSWSRVFGALMRHAWAWMRGESFDPELKTHHMINVAWNAIAIYIYETRKIGTDDRPKI